MEDEHVFEKVLGLTGGPPVDKNLEDAIREYDIVYTEHKQPKVDVMNLYKLVPSDHKFEKFDPFVTPFKKICEDFCESRKK